MYLAEEVGEHFCQECHCALLARHLSLAAVDLHDLGPHKLKPCTASALKKNGGWEKVSLQYAWCSFSYTKCAHNMKVEVSL